jgi:hypothetical protein
MSATLSEKYRNKKIIKGILSSYEKQQMIEALDSMNKAVDTIADKDARWALDEFKTCMWILTNRFKVEN